MKKSSPNITICISGTPAATTGSCGVDALEVARDLGREMAQHNITLTTTSTTGFPLWTAMGAQQEEGLTIAFSPAANEHDHTDVHKLPIEYFHTMIYTGFGTAGAGVLALRSSDAVIFGCGGMASALESTMAINEGKPIGILEGSWKTDEVLRELLSEHYPGYNHVIVDSDPKRLLEQLIKMVKVMKKEK